MTLKWTHHVPNSDAPSARRRSTATVYNNHLYILFGYDDFQLFSDIYKYNFQTRQWTLVKIPSHNLQHCPTKRCGHIACLIGNRLYVFGGTTSTSYFDDLYYFNLDEELWMKEDAHGDKPCARSYLSGVCKNDSFYIFGGYAGNLQMLNDLKKYDPKTREWKDIQYLGKISKRCSHGATVFHESMFIFGGLNVDSKNSNCLIDLHDLYEYNFIRNQFTKLEPHGKIPPVRSCTVCVTYDSRIFVFGGFGDTLNVFYNDLYEYNIAKNEWKAVQVAGDIPRKRTKHCGCVWNDSLFVFGGLEEGKKNLNDLMELQFELSRLKKRTFASLKNNEFVDVNIKCQF